MKKKRIVSLLLAIACIASLLAACSGADNAGTNAADTGSAQTGSPETGSTKPAESEDSGAEHEPITMTAMVPFRNPSHLAELVHEKYPEINIEFVPYSGYNATAYTHMQVEADDMTDIYFGSMYNPETTDMSGRLLDLSAYAFTDNFTDQRLREVTDNGSIYLLPLYYSVLGVTYNKTLLEEHGWSLPNSLEELEALAAEVEASDCNLALSQVQFPGAGFQYLFNILSAGYINTIEGRKWQNAFLAGETTAQDNADLMAAVENVQRWRDSGMLTFNGDPESDTSTCTTFLEGNTLFLIGVLGSITNDETTDEFGFMPYLSADGEENTYIANVTKFVGLNKHLADEGNEQKLEDALHIMEVICTVDGMRALSINTNADVLIPLKDFVIPDDSVYKTIEAAINEGYVAPYVYTGWEDLVVPVGEKMFSFMRGECDVSDVIRLLDESQHLIFDNADNVYTIVTETLSVDDCTRLVGIQFAKASGADVALVSTNKWYATDKDTAMNTKGVQCKLYARPITDQDLTAMLPTGWTGTIQTVTLTGARIRELAETGFDKFGDGEHLFPYSLIMPDGFTLDDETTYTVAICGVSADVQEEGNVQDTGLVGLTIMEEYLSRFETFSPADITWD